MPDATAATVLNLTAEISLDGTSFTLLNSNTAHAATGLFFGHGGGQWQLYTANNNGFAADFSGTLTIRLTPRYTDSGDTHDAPPHLLTLTVRNTPDNVAYDGSGRTGQGSETHAEGDTLNEQFTFTDADGADSVTLVITYAHVMGSTTQLIAVPANLTHAEWAIIQGFSAGDMADATWRADFKAYMAEVKRALDDLNELGLQPHRRPADRQAGRYRHRRHGRNAIVRAFGRETDETNNNAETVSTAAVDYTFSILRRAGGRRRG